MRPADWAVMALALATVVLYGLWRARGKQTTQRYMLANKQMPWYAMALSIMATQASAITFISTTGQSYVDGMRFVQFYFGLPLAMILICAVAVPIYHRTKVYTAYEYLEQRFDARTRALVAGVFLIQRGLGVGVSLAAPAVVMTVILGWPEWATTTAFGLIIVIYTVKGGITAITWSEFLHMIILSVGLVAAFLTAVLLLPPGVHFSDALAIAGAAHKLNPVVWKFNLDDRYNVWSGLIGGLFLSLAYFGCDQSQVQRYLTGRSITQSRLSLLFNAVAKIPMQFAILFIGAMVFVFFVFEKPPAIFHVRAWEQVRHGSAGRAAEKRFYDAWEARKEAAMAPAQAGFGEAQQRLDAARAEAAAVVARDTGVEGADTNYIFLTFVTRYMPVGLVGLLIAAIFAAAMSTISAEINSLATVTVIDIYKRFVHGTGGDAHYLVVSRVATAFWGLYAVVTAQYLKGVGALIETVNLVGSLFYGGLLGVFALAFFFKRVDGRGAFWGVLTGEAAIFSARLFTGIGFLWYNVIGATVVVATGVALSYARAGVAKTN
ncbi:MAG: sodium:solute symporter [Bryobacteraceae bacterium]